MSHKSTLRVFLVAGSSALGSFYFGYSQSMMNPCQATVDVVFNYASYGKVSVMEGSINAILPLGATLGAVLVGPLISNVSRRQAMMVTDLISVVGSLLNMIVNIYMLGIARFIIGMALGLNSALVPLYVKEYTPLQLTGTMGAMVCNCINTGFLACLLLGLHFQGLNVDNGYWRVVFAFPMIAPILRTFLLLVVFKNEPPEYYHQKGDQEKTLEVLAEIYTEDAVQEKYNQMLRSSQGLRDTCSNYGDLITEKYKRRLLVGCLLSALQQLSGINAVMFYSTSIFKQISDSATIVNLLNLGVGVLNIVAGTTGGLLMKSVGRKPLLLFGDIACFILLVSLAILSYISQTDDNAFVKLLIVAFLYLYILSFQCSLGPIPFLYMAEILPEKGLSVGTAVNWICVACVALGFPIINDSMGIYACFALFGMVCFFGAFFIFFMLKETRGRTAISIDHLFSSQTSDGLLDTATGINRQTL